MSMRFRNFGGIYQFMVTDEEDLAKIDALDPARWAATSAPLHDLHCDPAFLKYVDVEGSGRVRVGQIVRARDWLFERLGRRGVVRGRHESIPVDALATTPDGEKLRAAALRVNREQKAEKTGDVALSDVRAFKAGYHKLLCNGDGVVPPDVVPEPDVAAFLKDVIAAVGGVKDRGGSDGVDAAHLETFKTRAQAWLDWRAAEAGVSPWGADTAAAAALVARLDPKIEEYFLHADLLAQEAPPDALLKLTDDSFRALRARDAAAIEAWLRASPIAHPDPKGELHLDAPIGAHYRDDVAALASTVVGRALGGTGRSLTRESWRKIRALFDAYLTWQKAKPAEPFDALGEDKVRAWLAGPLPQRVTDYITRDADATAEIDQVDELEKLLLYVRWLVDLANNFVNFSAIFKPGETALVEMGSLVVDGRRLEFCIKVTDRAAHKTVATESLIFLVYVKITQKDSGGESFEVVAPVTGGEKGRLRVGKRGIFIDNDGVEWDAQIVEVVENPISVREAMFAPFRRAAKFVGDKVEEWVGSAAAAHDDKLQSHTAHTTTAAGTHVERVIRPGDAAAPSPAPSPPPAATPAAAPSPPSTVSPAALTSPTQGAAPLREGLNVNTLILGGGIALAGVGAVLASLFGLLVTLKGWAAILGVVGAVLALSALNAWLKLRKRNMSVLLEANGWAVNVHTRITARIAKVFAFTPDLPKGATLEHTDLLPATDDEGGQGKTFVLLMLLAGAVVLAWYGHFKVVPRWF